MVEMVLALPVSVFPAQQPLGDASANSFMTTSVLSPPHPQGQVLAIQQPGYGNRTAKLLPGHEKQDMNPAAEWD
jgi:hypothetical protein